MRGSRSSTSARPCSPVGSPSAGPATSASGSTTSWSRRPGPASARWTPCRPSTPTGKHVGGPKPSKEAFLHAAVYRARDRRGRRGPPAQHVLGRRLLPRRAARGRRAPAADRLLRDARRGPAAAAVPRTRRPDSLEPLAEKVASRAPRLPAGQPRARSSRARTWPPRRTRSRSWRRPRDCSCCSRGMRRGRSPPTQAAALQART